MKDKPIYKRVCRTPFSARVIAASDSFKRAYYSVSMAIIWRIHMRSALALAPFSRQQGTK